MGKRENPINDDRRKNKIIEDSPEKNVQKMWDLWNILVRQWKKDVLPKDQ